MKTRISTDSDLAEIARIHRDAFGPDEGPEIVDLVEALFRDETARPLVSLVAEVDGEIAGHVLFTAAALEASPDAPVASILAPLGIARSHQRRGVGGLLVERGLELLTEQGVDLVFVLGHPAYYPRFGFEPAGRLGFDAPYPIPERNADAWMVAGLRPGAVERFAGAVACASALDAPQHWVE